ncbi:gyrB [Acrasis kona]|uniref:GyrB n=1 Tax=Acrasis kona TaxID=1008807 RepID=A0AAW2ZAZ0_9EUKA
MSFKSHQDVEDIKKQRPIKEDDDVKHKVSVSPWKPDGETPDLPEFEVQACEVKKRVSLLTLIPEQHFCLYTKLGERLPYGYYLDKGIKSLFMVLNEDNQNFCSFIQVQDKKLAEQYKINFQNRSWKKQKIEHKNAKAYAEERDKLERIVDAWCFEKDEDEEDDESDESKEINKAERGAPVKKKLKRENDSDDDDDFCKSEIKQFITEVRKNSAAIFKEWSKFSTHFKSTEDQEQFFEDLERCILPFKVKLDYYNCESLVRIYSPIKTGNFIDTRMYHHFRSRAHFIESWRSIVCFVGSLDSSDQSTKGIKNIKNKGDVDVRSTFVEDYIDVHEKIKGRINDVSTWKTFLFGDLPLSDHRFALFLCAASGLMSIRQGDDRRRANLFNQMSETGGVYNLILKNLQHDVDSDVDDAVDISL